MERKYKTVEEVKKRISALFKEGYLFSDIFSGKMYFIHSNEMYKTFSDIYFIVILPEEDFFIEKVMIHYSLSKGFSEDKNVKIYENYIFDIFDFYAKYGIYILHSYKLTPNIIEFKPKRESVPRYTIDMDDYNVQLSEEMLGEISFAHKIIKEYARKSIYDILCEYHQK